MPPELITLSFDNLGKTLNLYDYNIKEQSFVQYIFGNESEN